MSATNRGADRAEADYYPTPAWCVDRLLDAVDFPGGDWLEPAAGGGAIVRAVSRWRERHGYSPVHWTTVDLRSGEGVDVVADFVWFGCPDLAARRPPEGWNVAITNPPFSLALEFVQGALELAPVVAMLLRLNWLEGAGRAPWLRAHMPAVYVLPERPSFTGQGSDACAYAWLVWGHTPGHTEILASTSFMERHAGGREWR